jgi:hypothetical protein
MSSFLFLKENYMSFVTIDFFLVLAFTTGYDLPFPHDNLKVICREKYLGQGRRSVRQGV